jgi:HlyD family secretion protein
MKRAITIIVVLVILITGGAYARKIMTAGAKADVNQYRIAPAKIDLVKKTVTATGTLTAWTTVDIKSRAGGRLISLPVDEGSILKKGQVIADIDPSDTLLTVNQAKADIDNNRAHVDETRKTLDLQQQQTVVTIDSALANLNSARAAANASKARYASAQSQADAQKDLSEAAVDNALATLNAERERLDQMVRASQPQANATALAAMHQAEANLKNADAQLTRQQKLLDKGFVAQSQVDQALATRDVAQAALDMAREKINTIAPELDTDLKAEKAKVRQFEAALRTAEANRVDIRLKQQAADAARADYQQALANIKTAEAKVADSRAQRLNDKIRQTQIAQAQASGARSEASLTNANVQLKETHVTSPSDAIVLKKYVEQGTLITSGISFNSTGTSIVQLGDISRMYVDVQVDETDIASVDVDQKVDITFDAYNATPFEGKVIKIQPQAVVDQNVTTVHVRVEVDNAATAFRLLKPGLNATCEFVVKKRPDVLCVPNESLKTDNEGNHYVEVAEGGKPAPADKDSEADPNLIIGCKVVKKPVEIGLEGNDQTEIASGIKEGDRVITQTVEPTTATPGGNPFGGSKGPGKK